MKKYLKCNCIKSEPVQKDFSSILLKLQVTSLDSPQLVRTTFLQNASVSATSALYILQWFSSTNTINILIYSNNPFWVNALLKFHAFCILTAHLETSYLSCKNRESIKITWKCVTRKWKQMKRVSSLVSRQDSFH